jgi:hypothetical protein
VLVAVPFGKVCVLQFLLRPNVEGAPYCVQMLEDLEWGDVAIRRVAMLELRIELCLLDVCVNSSLMVIIVET